MAEAVTMFRVDKIEMSPYFEIVGLNAIYDGDAYTGSEQMSVSDPNGSIMIALTTPEMLDVFKTATLFRVTFTPIE